MSVDALVFVPDIAAVMAEVARILRPGSRFAFTAREQTAASVSFGSPVRPDYRPALKGAGFEIETYEETPDWADRQFALLRAMAAAEQQLRAEMDDESANEFMTWTRGRPAELVNTRRIFRQFQYRGPARRVDDHAGQNRSPRRCVSAKRETVPGRRLGAHLPGGRGAPIGVRRGEVRGTPPTAPRGTPSLTKACKRPPIAYAPASPREPTRL